MEKRVVNSFLRVFSGPVAQQDAKKMRSLANGWKERKKEVLVRRHSVINKKVAVNKLLRNESLRDVLLFRKQSRLV